MLVKVAFVLTIFAFIILENKRTNSFKTPEQLKVHYDKMGKEGYNREDRWVGKAMDLVYSNKTIMSLLAGELWDVGSKAIDTIVEAKRREYFP
ncbi:hypothetical protein HF086_009965 [Spodoptera exigua]|uniref:Uncharacterized protein n=1 Tax=Spodoptera exigua TaxID=7107 RepID=A0A922SMI1_SPOEX|nr:hypothetical protein HF086_009965 [Spodoptera exigua]